MKKKIFLTSLLVYSLFLLWHMFLGPYRVSLSNYRYNLIHFKTIYLYLKGANKIGFFYFTINIIGNIGMFFPIGFLFFYLGRNFFLIKIIISSLIFITFLEFLQLTFKVGIFDIDDIILNTFGITLGFIFMKGHTYEKI